ncbi:Stage II sporulation protein E (SpoIIE) [Raineya orbicola]|uniref:Stage II sporulation protein E (SpoIIE) n=2 Tax=Raineya orbicola TaxID=2016530 RepID=A0A2N3IC01_9BACT|nr:Stage II sporulation protein E (SpoIIE) [Raineya orbicola]
MQKIVDSTWNEIQKNIFTKDIAYKINDFLIDNPDQNISKEIATIISSQLEEQAKSDTNSVKYYVSYLNYLAYWYLKNDKNSLIAEKYLDKIFQVIAKNNKTCQYYPLLDVLPDVLSSRKRDFDIVEDLLKLSLKRIEKYKCYAALVFFEFDLATYTGQRKGDFKQSLKHLLRANQLIETYYNQIPIQQVIELYDILGSTFYRSSNYEKAILYWGKLEKILAEKFAKNEKYHYPYARILNNIGLMYFRQEKYDEAMPYYLKAIEVAKKEKLDFWVSLPKGNIGDILLKKGYVDSSYTYFQEYLNNAYKHQDWSIVVAGHTKMANYYLKKGNLAKAQENAFKADSILNARNKDIFILNPILINISRRNILQAQAEIFEKTGKYPEALKVQKEFIHLSDSINKATNAQQVLMLNAEFEVQKEELENDKLKKEIKQRELFLVISAIISLVSIILGIVTLLSRLKIQKQTALLQEKNEEILAINEALAVKNQDVMDSILYAERIQKTFLPYENRLKKTLQNYFILYKPKDIVSGDFYYVTQQNQATFIILGDCTGHGVPGALMSIMAVTLLDQIIIDKHIHEPAQILQELDKSVVKFLHQQETHNHDGMDISICVWYPATRKLVIGGAKTFILLKSQETLEEIRTDRYNIGGYNTQIEKIFTQQERILAPSTLIYLFSDGYIDQFNTEHRKIGKKRFIELIAENMHKPLQEQQKILSDFVETWRGGEEQIDDIAVMGVLL